jgi:hypothetical protein
MSGLTDLVTQSSDKTTTLPSWYTSAQQDAVNKATSGVNAMPAIGSTVAGTAINTLSGPDNPFTQAQGTLNTIATGAANPWLTDASGNVTPNTNTAMGGLFAAQNQQLKTLLPQYEAPATAGSISSGNFGSLRGQTAADTAVTNAQADLFTKQMQEALQNQQTGVNASTGLGNVGQQGVTAESTLGSLQQADPTRQAAALSSILSNIKAPASENLTTAASPLDKINQLIGAYKGLPSQITGPLDTAFGNILTSVGSDLGGILNSVGLGSSTSSSSSGIPDMGIPNIDTSGSSTSTFPDILGAYTGDNTDTSVYSPIDTSIGSGL